MNAKEYNNLMVMLAGIRDRLPVREVPEALPVTTRPVHAGPCWTGCQRPEHRDARYLQTAQVDKRQALAIVRAVLDDWIRGAKENHQAMGHRHENPGEECWRTFAPSDFRNMINDAARELGVDEFPAPEIAEEDKR